MSPSELPPPDVPDRRRSPGAGIWLVGCLVEVLLLVLLFAAYSPGGLSTGIPGANEPHYLCKARSFWDESFCPGDLFLESADAHYLFYFSLGLLTRFLPLAQAALLGRLISWLAIAIGWRFLIHTITGQRFWSIPAAAVLLLGIHYGHFAGEWLIGGVEAKGLAYAFVLGGLGFLVQRRWPWFWLCCGLASAFHVLVGGWAVIAGLLPWLADGGWKVSLKRQWIWGAFGLVFALIGLIPALMLTVGQDPELVTQANRIYTFERIAHHLLFFHVVETQPLRLDAFLFVLLFWIGLQWVVQHSTEYRRLGWFVFATVLIAGIAIAVEFSALRTGNPDLAARLLRYYWFRLSDVLVPVGVAVGLTLAIQKSFAVRYEVGAVLLSLVACLFVGHCLSVQVDHLISRRSVADALTLPKFPGNPALNRRIVRDWIDVCTWIRTFTPSDSRFITPRSQSTFKWYAQRSEVVSWKDVPQDAQGIVEWKNRFEHVFGPATFRFGLATLDAESRLLDLGKAYDAQYLVIERRHVRERKQELEYQYRYQQFLLGQNVVETPFQRPLCLEQVYPNASCPPEIRQDSIYLVYRLRIPDSCEPQMRQLEAMLEWYRQYREWVNSEAILR